LDNIKERDNMEYLGVNRIVISPYGLNRVGWEGMEGFIRLTAGIFTVLFLHGATSPVGQCLLVIEDL
jgi:hypothetical protein